MCAQHGHVVNGVQVPCGNTGMKQTTTRGQADEGDRLREGRLWEIREPMDKNRVEGRHGATSWHNTAKSPGMPVEVNAAAVRRSNVPLPGETSRPSVREESAEVIVVEETSRSAGSTAKLPEGLTR